MTIDGELVASGIRAWFTRVIEQSSAISFDLGKFFAGISSASLGLFLSLLKLGEDQPSLGLYGAACLVVLLLSLLIAIVMAMPIKAEIDSNMDIYDVYNRTIQSVESFCFVWLMAWCIGVLLAVFRLFINL